MKDTIKYEKFVKIIILYAKKVKNVILLVIIKVITGILTGSLAILSSAMDSLMDFFVSLFNLYVLKRSSSKQDETYNYGHGKIQGIGAVFEGAVHIKQILVLIIDF